MELTKDNYQETFQELVQILSTMPKSSNKVINDATKRIAEELEDQQYGCNELIRNNDVLRIGVVGQVKAGKSSFLNSLFFNGENVLPRASTPMTAGLTILQYGEDNTFEVEYYNKLEWQSFKDKDAEYRKLIEDARNENPEASETELSTGIDDSLLAAHELVSNCSPKAASCVKGESQVNTIPFATITQLQEVLETYVGVDGIFTSVVKSLTINLHDERLIGVQVIDTPGVNDPVVSREQRTRECLRGCHGVFLLSYSGRFFDNIDVSFLTNRIGDQGIGKVVVIASKFDSVLQDVGNKHYDDLYSAILECQNSLKMQMERNLSQSEYRGDAPILDYSSGIGFSIARKEESRLDGTERNVLSQMKRFFPSDFSTPEKCKELFYQLSSIEEIKDEYLEGIFIRNKDSIIKQKLYDYFSKSAYNISKIIVSQRERLQQMLNALNDNDINDIKKQKDAYTEIVNSIKSDMESITERANQRAEQAEKTALNGYSFQVPHIPTMAKTAYGHRLSTFWGRDKSFIVDYEVVDVNKLAFQLCDSFGRETDKVKKIWDSEQESILKLITDTMSGLIADRESEDTEGKLNPRLLRNILNETIDSMINNATLEMFEVVNQFNDSVANGLQGCDLVKTSFGSMSESEAKSYVLQNANQVKSETQHIVTNLVNSMRNEIRKEIIKSRENCLSVLTNNKGRFITSITENINSYLSELEKSLQDKEANIQILTNAIKPLRKLEDKLR